LPRARRARRARDRGRGIFIYVRGTQEYSSLLSLDYSSMDTEVFRYSCYGYLGLHA
jgi:hypothetical protein